jgi:two-component system, NarL family, sensor histidine kinase DesK
MPTLYNSRNAPQIGTQRGSGYVWLVYSVFFFIDPILRHSNRYWIQSLAIYAVFLAIYIGYAESRNNPQRYVLVTAFYLLGILVYPFNSGASCFFIYGAAFLPFIVASTYRFAFIMAAQVIGLVAEGLWFHLNPISIVGTIVLMSMIGGSNVFIARQKRMDCKLRAAQEENIQLAAVAERERIARDLHDVLGHTLSVIVLKAELARRLMDHDPQRAAQEIADVETTARAALTEVREAIGGYRSQGLAAEIDRARQTLDAANVTLTWEALPLGSPALNATEETVLALSVREAVTNIVRHAEATHCTMRFVITPDNHYALTVEDNGRHPIQQEGNGLRGMRDRVHGLGGRLSIRSDHGTTLLIELPVTSTQPVAPIHQTQEATA